MAGKVKYHAPPPTTSANGIPRGLQRICHKKEVRVKNPDFQTLTNKNIQIMEIESLLKKLSLKFYLLLG
jgi:hypothetical protein